MLAFVHILKGRSGFVVCLFYPYVDLVLETANLVFLTALRDRSPSDLLALLIMQPNVLSLRQAKAQRVL